MGTGKSVAPSGYGTRIATAKFLHAADLHLGAPLKSLGSHLDPKVAERFRKLVNTAFTRLVDTAIEEEVDFVVLAGDVYDTAERDPGAQRRFLLELRRLVEAGIKVFMVHGNHDPFTREIKNGLLPEGVTVFPAGKLGQETVTMRNGAEVVVAGISYNKKQETDNLVPTFAALTGRTIVGVLHTNVGGNTLHGNYAPSTVADLEASPVHYWALGHIHLRSVNRTNKGWWAYPGNLQGRSTKASECGAKGALIVEVEADGNILEPRFVECAALRFERVEVAVDDIDEIAGLNDVVNEQLRQVADSSEVPVLARVELVGNTDLKGLLDRDANDWSSVEDGIFDEGGGVLGDGAVLKVRSSCRPRVDLEQERKRETLLGKTLTAIDAADAESATKKAAIDALVSALRGAG